MHLATHGKTTDSCSPLALVGRSSRATWSGPSDVFARLTSYARSRCTTYGTQPRPCLRSWGVPARDAQIILGHSRLAVTLEIYTHEDRQAQREALGKISDVLRCDGQEGQ
jgi:integrase